MPQLARVLRFRRERRFRSRSRRRWSSLGLIAAGTISLALGLIVLALALTFSDLAATLPPVDDLERIFGASGREVFRPARVYDRTGETILFEIFNPAAADRRWIYLEPDGPIDIPAYTLQALLIALDEDFWNHPGFHRTEVAGAIADYLFSPGAGDGSPTITQRLALAQLAPLTVGESAAAARVQVILLAAEITRRYSREQILEWYLNSADFGHQAYGIDAAALVYFGKHASDLTLAESALLAPIPLDPGINPLDQAPASMDAQRSVLEAMVRAGVIGSEQARRAQGDPISIAVPELEASGSVHAFRVYFEARMQAAFGRELLGRSGLRILTSIDSDLQLQTVCTLESQLARLGGADASTVVPAADGRGCIAAGLLTPLRPKDAGVDHAPDSGALVVLDAGSGEVLSMVGGVEQPRPADPLFSPFVALTAFSQGYSPASMLIDVGSETSAGLPEASEHGPVRLRIALANDYQGAFKRLESHVGLESVARTLNSLGLRQASQALSQGEGADELDGSLLDLTYAYSVFAAEGALHGTGLPGDAQDAGLEPIVILQIEDGTRRLIFQANRQSRSLVSAQLSYLLVDILSDESARWPSLGRGNPLEVGRPAAALTGTAAGGRTAWTLGFTPQLVVGVRIDAHAADGAAALTSLNASAPVWHAALQFATRELTPASWRIPPGVSSLEVCDPSGLLPTIYCPGVVREIFIQGTEPTNYDNLFQPYLVNRETGKLATLDTPLELVEERVYMIVPPEAAGWAETAGIPQPPQEYDTLRADGGGDAEVRITSPESFAFLRGKVRVMGYANPQDLQTYRLQYGRGLNPTQWVQIGSDAGGTVRGGALGTWDTGSLSGLYTLQLIVVESSGRLRTDAVPVTIDNQAPKVDIELPEGGQIIAVGENDEIVLQAGVEDQYGVAQVVFYIDGQAVATIKQAPWSTRWRISTGGEHEIHAEATDLAGNSTRSEAVVFSIVRP